MSGAQGVKKKAWDPLELDLQIVIRCHVDTGNQIRVLDGAANALNH